MLGIAITQAIKSRCAKSEGADMTPMQEIVVKMSNGDVAYSPILKLGELYQANIDYQVSSGPGFNPTNGPKYGAPYTAFDWVIGTVAGIAQVRSANIIEIDSPCSAEFLSASDQKDALAKRGLSVDVFVNGQRT